MALVAIVLLFWMAFATRPADPIFEGKRASDWTRDLLSANFDTSSEAQTALKTLGEPAVPQLRVLLQRRNGPWEEPLLRLGEWLPFFDYQTLDAHECRVEASEMLAVLGPKAQDAVPELIAALVHDGSASASERALVHIGPAAVPSLERALKSRKEIVRVRAARLLREFSPAEATSIKALVAATDDSSEAVREEAAFSLGRMLASDLPNKEAAVGSLLALANDPVEAVRAAVMQALGDSRIRRGDAIEALNSGLRDVSPLVSIHAAKSLWSLRQPAEGIVPVLIAILETRERWRAAYVLADMGSDAAPAVLALGRVLVEERVPRPFRTPPSSAVALGKIGAAAIPELVRLVQSGDPRVRMNVLMAFSFMGKSGQDAVPQLVKVLEDEDLEVRHTAALTLASIGAEPEKIMAGLSDCLQAEDIYMRSAAAAYLREIAPDEVWNVAPE